MTTLSDTVLSEVNGGIDWDKVCDFIYGGNAASIFFIGSGVGTLVFGAFSIGSTVCVIFN